MKKTLSILLVTFLLLSAVFCLASCGDEEKAFSAKEQAGEWVCEKTVTLGEVMNAANGGEEMGAEEQAAMASIGSKVHFNAKFTLTVNEDGTGKIVGSADIDKNELISAFAPLIKAQYPDASEEQIGKLAEEFSGEFAGGESFSKTFDNSVRFDGDKMITKEEDGSDFTSATLKVLNGNIILTPAKDDAIEAFGELEFKKK